MACIQEVRPAFKRLHRKPTLSQPGHDGQRNGCLSDAACSAGYQ
jgi:hypothetical protein